MLYRPDAFEPLTDERWDADRVCDAIREIVADTDSALRGPKLLWPADDWDRWQATSPMKNLYVGTAGCSGRSTSCAGSATRRRGSTSPISPLATSGSSARGPIS